MPASALRERALRPPRPEVVVRELPGPRPAWVELATSGDHKRIGTLWITTAIAFGVLALVELLLMRLQLATADGTLLSPEIFGQLLSVQGLTAVALFALPLAIGLASYVVPLQIGARAIAFPRLAQLGWWLYLAGGVSLYASFLYQPPAAGPRVLAPLSGGAFSQTHGVDAWLIAAALATGGLVLAAISVLTTVHSRRAPGMVWRRLPPFAWASVSLGYLVLAIGPVLLAAVAMLFADRNFSTVFFEPGEGGAPLLWAHLTSIYLAGAYAGIVVFAFGAISEILPVFARRPAFSPRAIAASLVAIAALGPLTWIQSLYSAPLGIGWSYTAMAFACMLCVPVGVILVNWVATLWRGSIALRAPLLWALGAISTTTIGLAGELAYSLPVVGWQLGGTADSTATTGYAMIGAAVFGGVAALHYWLPKVAGRTASDGIGKAAFWVTLIGVHAMLGSLALAGLNGQPADIHRHLSADGWEGWNLAASVGAFVFAAGVLTALANLAHGAKQGVESGHDPWRGRTLEWFAPSPPPPNNFDLVPDVRSEAPLADIRAAVESRTL